jgi:hypothetical protein
MAAYSARATNDITDNQFQEFRNLPNGPVVASFAEGTSFLNVTALTAATTLKAGQGTFSALMINTKGSTGNVITVYDSLTATGTKIATIDTTSSLTYLPYNAAFVNGLTISNAVGTSADVTIMYL